MRLLPGFRGLLAARPAAHQGGWDEALLFFGVPLMLFLILRWLGVRRERRQAEEEETQQVEEGRDLES